MIIRTHSRSVQAERRDARLANGFVAGLRIRRDQQSAAEAAAFATSPWAVLRAHARSIGVAVATSLLVLVTVELAVFRSGFFISHLTVSTPDFPAAKLALAARQPDARVLYVGDSTILTGIAPAVVSAVCECGPGFNGAFAAANAWLTGAMTRRLLNVEHPSLVVIGVSPWGVESGQLFIDNELAHELLSPGDFAALGAPLGPVGSINAGLGELWSPYGQRLLLKEWAASLAPRQRYDEAQRGFYVWPGSATSPAQLAAAAARMKAERKGEPTSSAPGAIVTGSLIAELRGRGIAVAVIVPPLHPAAYQHAGPFLEQADAAARDFALQQGVLLIDCRSAVSAADFRDLDHLSESGAVKHSSCVGRQIRALIPG